MIKTMVKSGEVWYTMVKKPLEYGTVKAETKAAAAIDTVLLLPEDIEIREELCHFPSSTLDPDSRKRSSRRRFKLRRLLQRVTVLLAEVVDAMHVRARRMVTEDSSTERRSEIDRRAQELRVLITVVQEVLRLWVQGCFKKLLSSSDGVQGEQKQQQFDDSSSLFANQKEAKEANSSLKLFLTSVQQRQLQAKKLQQCWDVAQELIHRYDLTIDQGNNTPQKKMALSQNSNDHHGPLGETPQVVVSQIMSVLDTDNHHAAESTSKDPQQTNYTEQLLTDSTETTPLPKYSSQRNIIHNDKTIIVPTQLAEKQSLLLPVQQARLLKQLRETLKDVEHSESRIYRERRLVEHYMMENTIGRWTAMLGLMTLKSLEKCAEVKRRLRLSGPFATISNVACVRCGASTGQPRMRLSTNLGLTTTTTTTTSQDTFFSVSPARTSYLDHYPSTALLASGGRTSSCVYCSSCGEHYDLAPLCSAIDDDGSGRRQYSYSRESVDGGFSASQFRGSGTITTGRRSSLGKCSSGRLSLISLISLDNEIVNMVHGSESLSSIAKETNQNGTTLEASGLTPDKDEDRFHHSNLDLTNNKNDHAKNNSSILSSSFPEVEVVSLMDTQQSTTLGSVVTGTTTHGGVDHINRGGGLFLSTAATVMRRRTIGYTMRLKKPKKNSCGDNDDDIP